MARRRRERARDDSAEGVAVVRTGADDIDPDTRIRHYDQLTDRGQQAVAAAVRSRRTSIRAPKLSTGDVVRFTDYYEVR